MASRSFNDMVDSKMPDYLRTLKSQEFAPDDQGNLPLGLPNALGIYCFYENGKPLYVGRSRNIRNRVLQHRRQGSGHNAAQFAFNIAKRKFKKKYPNKDIDNLGRDALAKDCDFDAEFTAAKDRVRKMSVRFVKIEDPIKQTIFEVYAHINLGTPFNDFETH